MFLFLKYVKKLCVFIFNESKSISVQTQSNQKIFKNQIIQTDIKMLDFHKENEWDNLTWIKSIPISINTQNLIDII